MTKCVCCQKSTKEWIYIAGDKKSINYHLTQNMEKYKDISNDFYLYICQKCRLEMEIKNIPIKQVRYNFLLKHAANLAFQ